MREVKYFVVNFDKINEGLKFRSIDADSVINIVHVDPDSLVVKQQVIVYYKTN